MVVNNLFITDTVIKNTTYKQAKSVHIMLQNNS